MESLRHDTLQAMPVLAALLVAAFVAFYPQLEVAGYCVGGGCPEVSSVSSATHASGGGSHAGGAHGVGGVSGVCLLAALVSGSVLAVARTPRLASLIAASRRVLPSLCLSPDPPPPQQRL
ncbi:hypothetical protein [Rubrobacter aplysinae]|uniref:hypothetical protein n=1 Tax=Rubrobacter aplysinae TaxID=909625 RepID=UPI00128B087C|nr:hypothetical protein [Rubrobacter aplysinae]